jgi:RHS repeat-associated protein
MPYDTADLDLTLIRNDVDPATPRKSGGILAAMKEAGSALVASAKRKTTSKLLAAFLVAGAALTAPQAAEAQSQTSTATVTGTIAFGIDVSGVFGTPERNLAGLPFTVVFTFDGGMGKYTQTDCGGVVCKTETQDNSGTMSPGSAVLTVGSGSYTFSQSTGSIDYRIVLPGAPGMELDVAINANPINSHVVVFGSPPGGTSPPWTSDPNYWDAFSYSSTGLNGSFSIYAPNGKGKDSASGEFKVSSWTVSGPTTISNAKTFGGPICPCATDGPQPANNGSNFTLDNVPGQPFSGEPINLATGNVFESTMDYRTAGQNPLTFVRYYNSLENTAEIDGILIHTYATSMGTNWRSNYDRFLHLGTSTVNAERPDGQILTFMLKSAVWTPDSDVDVTLTKSGSTWTLTDHNDTVETYTTLSGGAYAQLNSIKLRDGYTMTMGYNGSNQLTSVRDSYSRELVLSYSGELLESVFTPDSTTIKYGYKAAGSSDVLSSVSYPTTPATGFTYQYTDASFPFALTDILDGAERTYASWTYDTKGRATSSQFGSRANLTTVTYNPDGSRTVTNAEGVADTYNFTSMNGVWKMLGIKRAATSTTAAATESFYYDKNGYPSTVIDWNGNTTTYINDSHGDPTSITEASGSSVARTTTIVYDMTFAHLPHQIVTPGLTSTFVYDTSGNPLNRTDTDTTTNSVPYSTKGQTRETRWTWNGTGEMLSVQLPRTDVTAKTSFNYASDGALIKITDALSHSTQITTHTGGGYPLTISDPNNVVTTNLYDGGQRLLTSTLATGAGHLITTWGYDTAGNLASLEKPDGSKLSYVHDTAHRLTGITDLLGNSITFTLDALGDTKLAHTKNSTGTLTLQHSATFDALGRMLTDVGGMSQTTTYTYDKDSNVLTVEPPAPSGTVTMTYDALNRLSTSTDPSPGGTTTTTWDTHNRLLSVKDANSHTTSYVYDGFGDRTQTASPDSGTTVFRYDPDRNLTQRVQPGGLTRNATFDALDRSLTVAYTGDTTLNVSNTYDQTGHGFGVGRLTSATDQVGSLTLTYDERGNVTKEIRTPTGLSALNTSTTFDGASNVSSITYPSGNLVSYGRDSMGEVTSVTSKPSGASSATNIATGITYEPFGPVAGLTFGNGIKGTYGYDLDYRPTTRKDIGSATVQNLAYAYYANDSVHTITDALNAANTQTLNYDNHDRLTSAVSGTGGYGTFSFTWDPVNNIKTQVINGTTTTYDLKAGTNQLASIVTGSTTENVASTPTGNINTLKEGSTTLETLTYNKANQLSGASTSTHSASYAFDEFGKRIKEVGSTTGTTTLQYDRDNNLLTDTDGAGHSRVDYIYLNGTPIGTYQPSNNKFYFISTDRLGTPQKVTDSTKTVQWTATYQPFGYTGTGASGIVQNLRLPGQEWEMESGLNHNGFRDYATTLTRYVQSDPIGLKAGMNTYQYANGNAFKFVDPKGLQVDEPGAPNPIPSAVPVIKTFSKNPYSTIMGWIGFCNPLQGIPPNGVPSQDTVDQRSQQAPRIQDIPIGLPDLSPK